MSAYTSTSHDKYNDIRSIADEIKTRLPLLTYLEQQGYDVKPSGPNRFVMLCPFHNEKTPSCMVPPPEGIQTAHCFGCGATFDLFTFVERTQGIPFMDALQLFADDLHIEYTPDNTANKDTTPRSTLREIVAITAKILNYLYDKLPESHPAKRMVSKRNINTSNNENYNLFGWAPEDDTKIVKSLIKHGYTQQQLIEAGVAREWNDGSIHFPWRSRLMFTIRDLAGNPIAFTGRIVYQDDASKGKYVNSADNALFHKSNVLFCADIARKPASETKTVYVVEGQFDVIACQHAGRLNTVASSGTAFTESHASLLRRLVSPTGRIVFMFDADEAGQKAALRTFKAAPGIQSQSYATIPVDGKDASDMYRENPDSLRAALDNIHPLYHHIIDWLYSNSNMKDDASRRKFIMDCLDAYATIIDPVLQDNFITYMALKSGANASSLRAMAASMSKTSGLRKPSNGVIGPGVSSSTDGSSTVILDSGVDDLTPEDYILALAVEQPQLRARLAGVHFANADYNDVRNIIMSGNVSMLNDNNVAGITRRLELATEMMRQFEGFSPLVDVDGLFDAQLKLVNEHYRDEVYSRFHSKNSSAITSYTNPVNVKAYEDSIRNITSKLDSMIGK